MYASRDSLATDLDQYLLENRIRFYDRQQEVRAAPVGWLNEIRNVLQDPEVFTPIMLMLDDSMAIENADERERFIHAYLSKGYKAMTTTGHWTYESPA
jgi:hypothetical protein